MQRRLSAFLAASLLTLVTAPALADRSIIKQPGQHPKYAAELEPHLLLGLWNAPGHLGGDAYGLGLRASFPIVDNGFVSSINNSVAIGVGLDWFVYDGGNNFRCVRYDNGPGNNRFCVETAENDDIDVLVIPVVMQWNFFLSENWSVFGEPGLAVIRYDDDYWYNDDRTHIDWFTIYGGGRWHFSDAATLTIRLGVRGTSVGVSFLL